MKRGELSNEPAPVLALEWEILVETSTRWLGLRTEVALREGAKEWLERNWRFRFVGVLVGEVAAETVIVSVLSEVLAEVRTFPDSTALRTWMARNPQVIRLFVKNRALLGLGDRTRLFSGWHEAL